jgi:hypothetical protein
LKNFTPTEELVKEKRNINPLAGSVKTKHNLLDTETSLRNISADGNVTDVDSRDSLSNLIAIILIPLQRGIQYRI